MRCKTMVDSVVRATQAAVSCDVSVSSGGVRAAQEHAREPECSSQQLGVRRLLPVHLSEPLQHPRQQLPRGQNCAMHEQRNLGLW